MDAQQQMFALQSPVGLRFGATIQVDSDRVTFEMDLKIPKGTECPFRMELSGAENTVMGVVRIEKILPKRGSDAPRYVARIIEMPPGDRADFDGWRRDLATGGVSRRLERDPEALKEQISSQMMSGLSESESKAVLERMNRRRVNYKAASDEAVVDFGLADEAATDAKDERDKIREQLRAVKEQGPPAPSEAPPAETDPELSSSGFAVVDLASEPEPSPPEPEIPIAAEVESESLVEVSSPSWMPPANAPAPSVQSEPVAAEPTTAASSTEVAPPSPPLVVVNADAKPIELTIVYLSHESFVEDYQRTLHTSAVTIDHPDLNELYQPVNVKIQLANGDALETIGHMVAQTPQGMAIALEFDAVQRAMLKSLAE